MVDRIEKRIELKAPVSRVWRALTDHREFGAWFRVALEGPFVAGAAGSWPDHLAGRRAPDHDRDGAAHGARAAVLVHLAPLRNRPRR